MKNKYLAFIPLTVFGFFAFSVSAQPLNQSSLPKVVTAKPVSCVSTDKKQNLIIFQNRIWECIGNVYVRETDAKVGRITAGNNVTVSRLGDDVTVSAAGGAGGGEVSLSATYGNSLPTAIAAIGAAKTTLLIDADTTLSSAVTIPTTLTLRQKNQARIIESGTASITFAGLGLENWESRVPLFALFEDGDIQWTGTLTPPSISSDLWEETNWGSRQNRATSAFTNKWIKINIYPGGTPTAVIYHNDKQHIHAAAGIYENAIPVYRNYIIGSNTKLTGEGKFVTFFKESSVIGAVQFITASGMTSNPFAGYNENIEISDIGFLGQIEQSVDSSASMVLLGNVTNGHIRNASAYRVHGFAFFLGGNGDNGFTARSSSITGCVVSGTRTQAIGLIGGSGIKITDNQFTDINPAILTRNDVVTNGTATITSATGGFANWQIGATYRLNKTGQTQLESTVISVPNANSLVLGIVVPYSLTGAELELTGTTAAVIDSEPNNQFAIVDNLDISRNDFYGQDARQSWSMITVQAGGQRATRNVTVSNNNGWGRYLTGEFLVTTLTTSNVGFMTYGIAINGVNTGVIQDNYIQGSSQHAILLGASRRLNVTGNHGFAVGASGSPPIPAIAVFSVADSNISNNIMTNTFPAGYNGAQSDQIIEYENSGLVSVVGAVITKLPMSPNDNPLNFQPFQQGLKVTIAGVDYTIASLSLNRQSATLTTSPTASASVTATFKFSNNTYTHNKAGTITLAVGSASIINAIGAGGSAGLDAAGVRATDLTGLGAGSATAIAATDTFISAFAKTKFQLTNPDVTAYKSNGQTLLTYNTGTGKVDVGSAGIRTDYNSDGGYMLFRLNFGVNAMLTPTDYRLPANYSFNLSSSNNDATAAADVGIKREAAGILGITNGSTGFGSLRLGLVTPATSTASCTAGTFAVDANFLYLCTALNTWKRSALATF